MDKQVGGDMDTGVIDRSHPRPAILVVDDDKRNLLAMERALEDIGTVLTAENPAKMRYASF